jgi:hypothetical protein
VRFLVAIVFMSVSCASTTPAYEVYERDGNQFAGAKTIAVMPVEVSIGSTRAESADLTLAVRRAISLTIPGVRMVDSFRDADIGVQIVVADRSCIDHCPPQNRRWFWSAELYRPGRSHPSASFQGGETSRSPRLFSSAIASALKRVVSPAT